MRKSRKFFPPYISHPIPPSREENRQTTIKPPMTTVILRRHSTTQPRPASLPVTWKPILGVPVTWTAAERARTRSPQEPSPPPFASAYVHAHPRPTWGLRRHRLPPTAYRPPPPSVRSKSGSLSRWCPGSLLFHPPSPASSPQHVPEVLFTFHTG